MKDDPWLDELKKMRAAMPDDDGSADYQDASREPAPYDESTLSMFEQIARGEWPVRMPMTMEIYAEGSEPQLRLLRRGERRCKPSSQVVTVVLEFDRAKVRDMMVEWFHSPRQPASSKLMQLLGLERVDRECFLETAAAHFAETLAETDHSLRSDPWFVEFLRDIHDYDEDLVPDLVSHTRCIDRLAGTRLCNVIVDLIAEPHTREQLGWLVAGAIANRIQEL
jgi:hypothetical protein